MKISEVIEVLKTNNRMQKLSSSFAKLMVRLLLAK